MPDTTHPAANPVSVPLVNEPWGIFKSLSVARKNLLRILPQIATKQAMVSGKTGKRLAHGYGPWCDTRNLA